jgi:hypothetical protein
VGGWESGSSLAAVTVPSGRSSQSVALAADGDRKTASRLATVGNCLQDPWPFHCMGILLGGWVRRKRQTLFVPNEQWPADIHPNYVCICRVPDITPSRKAPWGR